MILFWIYWAKYYDEFYLFYFILYNMVTRKCKIMYVACIKFLLVSKALESQISPFPVP